MGWKVSPGAKRFKVMSASSRGRPVKMARRNCSLSFSRTPGWAIHFSRSMRPPGSVRSEEQLLEVVFHFLEGDVDAHAGNDVVGELPIVIEAALIFELLDLVGSRSGSGEVLHGGGDGLAIALGNVYQDAVHVEDEDGLGIHNSPQRHRDTEKGKRLGGHGDRGKHRAPPSAMGRCNARCFLRSTRTPKDAFLGFLCVSVSLWCVVSWWIMIFTISLLVLPAGGGFALLCLP